MSKDAVKPALVSDLSNLVSTVAESVQHHSSKQQPFKASPTNHIKKYKRTCFNKREDIERSAEAVQLFIDGHSVKMACMRYGICRSMLSSHCRGKEKITRMLPYRTM